MPKISVVMPVYNGEKYLREAIDSILAQTYTDFEFIILDDGSADASRDIVRSYDDPRIRFYANDKNLGVAATLNRGLDLAQGEYVARMDADDISLPLRFEKQTSYLDAHPEVAVCGSWVECFGAAGGVHRFASDPAQMRVDMFFSNGLAHPSVMMRRSLFERERLCYDVRFFKMEDYALWLRVLKEHAIISLPEVLLRYRIHPNQVTGSYGDTAKRQLEELTREKVKALGVSAECRGFSVFAKNGKTAFTREETVLLISFLKELSHGNKATGLYDRRSFGAALNKVEETALSRFSRREAMQIISEAGGNSLRYGVKRVMRAAVQTGKGKMKTLLQRRKLKHRDFTLFSNNCWGGMVYQKYGLPYLSPTVGLFIPGEDFVRLCQNMEHYLERELVFIPWEEASLFPKLKKEKPYPIARLDDIEIYFMHYATEEEAAEKWNRRKKRINKDKLIVKLSQRENCSRETVEHFLALPYANKLCFAHDPVPGAVHVFELKDLSGDETAILERYFDELDYLNRL